MPQRGLWFDGRIALQRAVEVVAGPASLVLIDEEGERHAVEAGDLVRLDSTPGTLKLGHRSAEGWRLTLDEPIGPAIRAHLPARPGALATGISRRSMGLLIGFSALVTAAAALVIFAPEQVASQMPMSWERRLGAVYELPIAATRCESPRARAALDALVDRLDPEARSDGITLELVEFDMANAVALPAGRMVLFSGLLAEIADPDAVAGIVAHEIAHVRRRHVAAAMVRELGLGTVVTLLGGGAVAANAGDLLSLRFGRSAEAEADADAIEMLTRAGISPRPTAILFQRLAAEEEEFGSAGEFLSSHPLSAGRARRFAAAHDADVRYRPALDAEQFRALKSACAQTAEGSQAPQSAPDRSR